MTDEEIHNIYLHMSGKAEGLVEATGTADFPVMFARAILEYEGLTKDVQNMASKSTYKEQLETKEYERGFIDGMQKQMQSSVDKAVNVMTRPTYYIPSKDQREWVGLKDKPVAWGMEKDGVILDVICPAEHDREEGEYTIPLYTTPQPKQEQSEPVGWIDNKGNMICTKINESCKPLYTTPQRTWLGLTDEEMMDAIYVDGTPMERGRRVEAKLKEKNNAT
jgi:hypothetical protein